MLNHENLVNSRGLNPWVLRYLPRLRRHQTEETGAWLMTIEYQLLIAGECLQFG